MWQRHTCERNTYFAILMCMSTLREKNIDETELYFLTEGFKKRSGKLGDSHFTYYTSDTVTEGKNQCCG